MGQQHVLMSKKLEARLLESPRMSEEQILAFCEDVDLRTKRCADSWMVYESVRPGDAAYSSTLLEALQLFLKNHL